MYKLGLYQIESALRAVRRMICEARHSGNDTSLLASQEELLQQAQEAFVQGRTDDAATAFHDAMGILSHTPRRSLEPVQN